MSERTTPADIAGEGIIERTGAGWLLLAALAAAAILAACAWRLRFGVDFTDEAFYAVLPWRLATGARPFLDEYNILQTSALILVPIFKPFVMLRGTEGIILFARLLHLLLRLATAAAVISSSRRVIGLPAAIVASTLTVAFVPFNLPSVSYNTMAIAFFTAGAFIGINALLSGRAARADIASGLAHGAAVVVYPPMAFAVAAYAGMVMVRRQDRRPFAIRYSLAAAVAPLIVGLVSLSHGLAPVLRSLSYGIERASLGERAVKLYHDLVSVAPPRSMIIVLAGVIALSIFFRRARPLLVIVPYLVWRNGYVSLHSALGFAAWLAIAGALLWPMVRHTSGARTLYLNVWIPSTVAGLVTALNSSNGYLNYAVGGFAAAQATVVLLMSLVKPTESRSALMRLAAMALAVYSAAVLIYFQFLPTSVYRDADVPELKVAISSGPYAGLMTTEEKATFVRSLTTDVASVAAGRSTVLFFNNFPAGYLLTSLRPYAPSTWSIPSVDPQGKRGYEYYAERRAWPDAVVRLHRIPFWPGAPGINPYPPDNILNAEIERRYTIAVQRTDYDVLVLRGAAVTPAGQSSPPGRS